MSGSIADYDNLREAYDEYMAAPFGQLNLTFEVLIDAAKTCGFDEPPQRLKPWVEQRLATVQRLQQRGFG